MNLLIIGSSVEDHIIREGKEKISPGGIWFSSLAFGTLKSDNDTLYLCTRLERGKEELFSNEFVPFQKDFISYGDIPRIHLTLYPDKEREEHYENINEPLTLPFNTQVTIDGIYVNMITGTELTPENLNDLKKKFGCPVYLDIHSLARSIDSNNNRIFAPIINAEKWMQAADFIQGNEHEMEMLTGETEPDKAFSVLANKGVSSGVYTGNSAGADLYFKRSGELALHLYAEPSRKSEKSCVGCGDIFGASLFYNILSTRNLYRSLCRAVLFAETTAFALQHDRIQQDLRNLKFTV